MIVLHVYTYRGNLLATTISLNRPLAFLGIVLLHTNLSVPTNRYLCVLSFAVNFYRISARVVFLYFLARKFVALLCSSSLLIFRPNGMRYNENKTYSPQTLDLLYSAIDNNMMTNFNLKLIKSYNIHVVLLCHILPRSTIVIFDCAFRFQTYIILTTVVLENDKNLNLLQKRLFVIK